MSRRERKANAWQGKTCANCDAQLAGPFCHVCGQPEKTPIRDVVSLGTDAFDYLFDVDARLWRTLRDLFVRPGRLTQGYLAGKRMSFVRPLRIYLVTSALLFVAISSMTDLGMNVSDDGDINFGPVPAEASDEAPASDGEAKSEPAPPDSAEAAKAEMAAAATAMQNAGTPKAAEAPRSAVDNAAAAEIEAEADKPAREPIQFRFFDETPWHPKDNPLVFESMPAAFNERLNLFIGLLQHNFELAREDPKRLGSAFLRVLPQSLFVLLPLFALLLKVVLVFKRRLYMEHLMVAIHSHTFIYMAILAIIAFDWIATSVGERWSSIPYWCVGLTCAWIPINLFLTQKRVYRQTWWGACFAFGIISFAYLFLITLTIVGALVTSLANL